MRANSVLFYSLLATLVPCIASAGIRVGNMSRNNAQGYQQVNDMRYNAAANTATVAAAVNPIPADTPIPVSNAAMSNSIRTGDANAAENMAKLEQCSMIYPDGEFAWSRPTVGNGAGGASTCTAVVEMRAIGAGLNGSDAILARANLAAGDVVECNISHFPEGAWLPAAGEIEFPADAQPTIDDVIEIMNAEQKQNAGFKIAAGAILGGLGGNMAGAPEPGQDGILGGGKAKTNSTIIGALGGAALMAGNAYTGKVAGDTILSTGVNAAAGAVVGNIVATGDSVLRIEACTVDGRDTQCLWGYLEQYDDKLDGTPYISAKNPSDFKVCKGTETCEYKALNIQNATIAGWTTEITVENANGQDEKQQVFSQTNRSTGQKMDIATLYTEDGGQKIMQAEEKYCYINNKMESYSPNCDDVWIKLNGNVSIINNRTPAMVVNVEDNGMGWKKSDWSKFVSRFGTREVVGRTGRGVAANLDNTTNTRTLQDGGFVPLYQDSEDGGIIDLSNKARIKGTLTGAGVGGGMGAFAGYQGAQQDIEDRWVSAVQEYKDSLQKIYCATGTRFLSHYNDTVIIPQMDDK